LPKERIKNKLKIIIMKKKFLLLMCMLPALLLAQQGKNKPCNDKKRRIDELPCTIIERYGTDVIPDEETLIKYIDILINKRYSVDAEELKPYQISLIANEKVWKTEIKLNCRFCKVYININKNTGEVLNFYRSEE
jgi:hypothetical protein